jgi:hypothetical protein
LRRALGDIYRKASKSAEAMYAARGRPAHVTERQFQRMMSTGAHLWDHMGDAPVILLPCQRRPAVPPAESLPPVIRACYPDHIRCEDEVRTLIGLPNDFDTFAMMPIGWPIDSFGPLTRRPLSEFVHVDGWGKPWPQ